MGRDLHGALLKIADRMPDASYKAVARVAECSVRSARQHLRGSCNCGMGGEDAVRDLAHELGVELDG